MSRLFSDRRTVFAAGCAAVFFYLLYAGHFIYLGEPENLLWICHFGCFLAGIGILIRSPYLLSTGFLWLCAGVPLWIMETVSSSMYHWSSFFTHIGGFAAGAIGIRAMGIKKWSWLVAAVGMVGMGVLARILTPPTLNINIAFSVWKGWEKTFTNYPAYILVLIAGCSCYYFLVETSLRRFIAAEGVSTVKG